MNQVAVVYWSGTGNTEIMANIVADSAKEAGAEVSLFTTADFSAEKMEDFDTIGFGCPSMGDEVLEEMEFQPLYEECRPKLSGKKIALFGSYDWGDGEWMRNWEEEARLDGATLVSDSVICNLEPDTQAEEALKALGKALAQS